MTDLNPELIAKVADVIDVRRHGFRVDTDTWRHYCTCGWTAEESNDVAAYDRHLAELALEAVADDLRAEAERMSGPEVSLEWNANDEGPPCIDFTCLCGHWQHLCNGPDWIAEGLGQAPGVECVKCGTAWSLYRVRITAMIREETEPDPLDEDDHRDRLDRHGDIWQRVHEGCWMEPGFPPVFHGPAQCLQLAALPGPLIFAPWTARRLAQDVLPLDVS